MDHPGPDNDTNNRPPLGLFYSNSTPQQWNTFYEWSPRLDRLLTDTQALSTYIMVLDPLLASTVGMIAQSHSLLKHPLDTGPVRNAIGKFS